MAWLKSKFLLIAGILFAVSVLGAYVKGRMDGHDKAVSKHNLEKMETVNENIRIIEKAKDVRRPDDNAYRHWLQSQSR